MMKVAHLYTAREKNLHFLCVGAGESGYGRVGKRMRTTKYFDLVEWPSGDKYTFMVDKRSRYYTAGTLMRKGVNGQKHEDISLRASEEMETPEFMMKEMLEWGAGIAKDRIRKKIAKLQAQLDNNDDTLEWVTED